MTAEIGICEHRLSNAARADHWRPQGDLFRNLFNYRRDAVWWRCKR